MLAKMNLMINQDKTYQFDIDEILNIKVFVAIEHKQYLRITARNISRDIGDYCSESVNLFTKRILEKNEITEVDLDKIIDLLNNLKFNRIKGEFYLGNDTNNTTIEELEEKNKFYERLNSNFIKVRKIYENCAICFEPTMCKGKCSHFCCYPCWNNIEDYVCDECKESNGENDCDDELCYHQRCPVCRQKLAAD
jgi:hypothetical protein